MREFTSGVYKEYVGSMLSYARDIYGLCKVLHGNSIPLDIQKSGYTAEQGHI